MKKFLVDRIVDPADHGSLKLQEGILTGQSSGAKYRVLGDVPVLLQEKRGNQEGGVLQEKVFDYKEHYQRDAEIFDYMGAATDGATLHENSRLHQTIIREVNAGVATILDVGCGNAWVSRHFCPQGVNVISMDISTVNPSEALRRNPSEHHAALVGDVFQLPIKNGSVDCIIASEIMEHVTDPKLFLEKLVAALAPGGTLLVTTPYDEKIRQHLCIHCNCATPENAHLHSFNEKNIVQYLPQRGVRVATKKFSNKRLNQLKTHYLMKYMPFAIWKAVDAFVNKLIGHETRLMIKIQKVETA